MKVICSSCSADYQIDDKKIPATGAVVKCKQCSAKIKLPPPGDAAIALPGAPKPPAAADAKPASIPLPGSAPAPASSKPTSIPLPGSAPTPPDDKPASIPLPGSAPTPPDAKPASIPLPGSAPTPPSDKPLSIPLPGSPPAPPSAKPVSIPLPPSASSAPELTEEDDVTAVSEIGDLDPIGDAQLQDEPAIPLMADGPGALNFPDDDLVAIPLDGFADADAGLAELPPAPVPAPAAPPEPAFDSPSLMDLGGDDPAEAIPLSFTEDVPMADGPRDTAPGQIPDMDALFDLPAAVSESDAADADTVVGAVPPMPQPVDQDSPTPAFLDDLPATLGSAPSDHDQDTVTQVEIPNLFDDLPAPEGPPGFAFDDLPGAAGAAPDLEADLPVGVDAGPGLMDDLPAVDAPRDTVPGDAIPDPLADGLNLDELPSLGGDADPFAAAAADGSLNEGMVDVADPQDATLSALVDSPTELSATLEEAEDPFPGEVSAKRSSTKVVIYALLGLAVVGGMLVQFGPMIGVDVMALTEFRGEVTPPPAPKTKAKSKAKAKKTKVVKAPAVKPQAVALTRATVDTMGFVDLAAGAKTLAATDPSGEQRDLLWWSWYRLARVYGDPTAKDALVAAAPRKLDTDDIGALGAAAGVGAMLLQDKVAPAKRTADRLRKKFKNSGHMSMVAGDANVGPGNKATKFYERASKLEPNLIDSQLAAGRSLLKGRNTALAVSGLTELGKESKDDDFRVRVASALIDAGQFATLDDVTAGMDSADTLAAVAPSRHSRYLELVVRRLLMRGDVDGALAVSKKRCALDPQSAAAAIEFARLQQAGAQRCPGLATAFDRIEDEAAKAEVFSEQVRTALAAGNVESAQSLIDGLTLPKRSVAGWAKLSEGRVAEKNEKPKLAKLAYIAATKGRPKFAEPRLAQILLDGEDTAARMPRLTQLARLSESTTVDYHLALAMKERNNPGGALMLIEGVLWRDPTSVDPIELVLTWLSLLHGTGKTDVALKKATMLHESRPKAKAPVHLLIELAEASGDVNAIAKWWQILVSLEPENFGFKASLAAQLMNGGRDGEARTLLDDLASNKAANKDPEVLYQLGRAWSEREPIKARGYLIEARAVGPSGKVYLLLGAIDQKRGKYDTAKEAFRSAIEIDPEQDEARRRLSELLIAEASLDEAETQLRTLHKKNPQDARVAELLGDALTDMDRPKDAVKAYQKASAALSKPRGDLMLKIAKLQLQRLEQTGPAVRTLKKVIEVDPKQAEAHYFLGYALKDMGRSKDARVAFENYLKVAPEDELAEEVRKDLRDLSGRRR